MDWFGAKHCPALHRRLALRVVALRLAARAAVLPRQLAWQAQSLGKPSCGWGAGPAVSSTPHVNWLGWRSRGCGNNWGDSPRDALGRLVYLIPSKHRRATGNRWVAMSAQRPECRRWLWLRSEIPAQASTFKDPVCRCRRLDQEFKFRRGQAGLRGGAIFRPINRRIWAIAGTSSVCRPAVAGKRLKTLRIYSTDVNIGPPARCALVITAKWSSVQDRFAATYRRGICFAGDDGLWCCFRFGAREKGLF